MPEFPSVSLEREVGYVLRQGLSLLTHVQSAEENALHALKCHGAIIPSASAAPPPNPSFVCGGSRLPLRVFLA